MKLPIIGGLTQAEGVALGAFTTSGDTCTAVPDLNLGIHGVLLGNGDPPAPPPPPPHSHPPDSGRVPVRACMHATHSLTAAKLHPPLEPVGFKPVGVCMLMATGTDRCS